MNDLTLYKEYRPHMDTMDLLQWRTDSFIGWSIRKKTGGYFNHTGGVMAFPDIGGDNRRWTAEAIGKGLMINYLSKSLSAHSGEVWWFPLIKQFKPAKYISAAWIMERVGTDYDYGSLFKNLVGKVSADAANLFCSETYFLAWHWAAVYTWHDLLKHLRFKITDHNRYQFIIKGMEEYYKEHPDERPQSPTPADILETLKIYATGFKLI